MSLCNKVFVIIIIFSVIFFIFIEIQLIYSVCCVSFLNIYMWGVYIYKYFRFFSIIGYYSVLCRVLCVVCRSILVMYFIYSSMSMLIPKS